jgi:AraC-like DNA-binding protein
MLRFETTTRSSNALAGIGLSRCFSSDQQSGCDARRAAALERVRHYVEQHLIEPDLAPERVACAVGLSLRQLHRVFEPTGTSFARHVLEQRLAAARAELANPVDTGRTVADIAFAWGFNNLVTFYRAFRRAYGCAPGEVRPAARWYMGQNPRRLCCPSVSASSRSECGRSCSLSTPSGVRRHDCTSPGRQRLARA